ncbi:sensor histidine kinase [Gephyromycinifex aptenodytis]|uniref:sensor histidine kinase n=1 Tax=Gephyromycinifex aptenodytis TaxID=2716227 RepID=UPI0014487C4D|nr:hypothetical protein [Gephyromycinifex aptenodytis]
MRRHAQLWIARGVLIVLGLSAADDARLDLSRGDWRDLLAQILLLCVCLVLWRGARGAAWSLIFAAACGALSMTGGDGVTTLFVFLLTGFAVAYTGRGRLVAAWVVGVAVCGFALFLRAVPLWSAPGIGLPLMGGTCVLALGLTVGDGQRRALRAEEQASEAEVARREAERRLAEAREADRRALADELHHGVARKLALASMRLGLLAETHGLPEASEVEALCREATNELRLLMGTLTAGEGESSGVAPPAVSSVVHAEAARLRHGGHAVEVFCPDEVTEPLRGTVGRIVEEAVANITRHAGAQAWCSIRVEVEPEGVRVEVRNTVGQGGGEPGTRLGLLALERRCALLYGTLWAGLVGGEWVLEAFLPAQPPDGASGGATPGSLPTPGRTARE